MDCEAEIMDERRVVIRAASANEPKPVLLSTNGRPLLRVACPSARLYVENVDFICNSPVTTANDLKQRCVWMTGGYLRLRGCRISSDSGIGVCVLRSGIVRC